MADPKVVQKAPFVIDTKPGVYYWCACGLSSSQPFCNGAHKTTDLIPMKVEITEQKQVAWCGCKNSKNKPFCDGTHKSI
jgi:CDGSH iron-sulfur domain-containing protein 3